MHPLLCTCNTYCCGFGRLDMAQQCMVGAETEEDMMEAIHQADWRRIIEDIRYSHIDENGTPVFVDKDGNPSIDYRGELPELFAVSDDGHYISEDAGCAEQFAMDNNMGDQIGHIGFTLSDNLGDSGKQQKRVMSEYEKYITKIAIETFTRFHGNCTIDRLMNPANFYEVKQAMTDFFTKNNAFELLDKYKAGDDKPIRDKGDIFTTGMNFGVNCAKKHLMVRFFEDPEAVYEYQW